MNVETYTICTIRIKFHIILAIYVLELAFYNIKLYYLTNLSEEVLPCVDVSLLIVGFMLLAVSKSVALFSLAAILLGAGNGMVWPTLQTMIINMVEPHRRGVANSTYMSALDLGIVGGSIFLGWLAGFTSLSVMYLVCGLLIIVPLIYFNLSVVKTYQNQVEPKQETSV